MCSFSVSNKLEFLGKKRYIIFVHDFKIKLTMRRIHHKSTLTEFQPMPAPVYSKLNQCVDI